ncbi:MAG: 30S ribosomal protein S27e [Candidatus Micrarchaeota archaeon]|nr:30S ribosomal protein S27e [Candidatus Micrarchaeota archaeon]
MSKFLRVQCDCGAETTVFADAKTAIFCQSCGNPLLEPKGGHAKVLARVLEVFG